MDLIDLFLRLLSAKSETPNDAGLLDFIANYLSDFEAYRFDEGEIKSIFLTKKFADGEHLCFSGHIDVVPAGNGWNSEPYTPKIEDGKIYARGAQDMKSGVAAFVQACKEVHNFKGRLSIMLTSDEEADGIGTQNALKGIKTMGLMPNYAIIAEPTCEEQFGDAIKIGRRGSVNGVLKLYGKQGHAAYPAKSVNVINLVAPILPKIAGKNLDNGDEFFEPSQFVITDIRAGMEVTNVTPGLLKMMFNVRNSTKTTVQDIEEFVRKNFDGLRYELEMKPSANSFMTTPDSKVVKLLQKSIKDVCKIETNLSTAGGTSDARFFGLYGVDTIEFGVINDTIHAPNERTTVQEVKALNSVFNRVLKEF